MLSFFGKIKNIFAKPNNKKVIVFVCLIVLFGLIFLVEPTKAFGIPTVDEVKEGFLKAITSMLFGISSWFIKMTVWISQVFIVIASYSNFINSSAVKLGWVLVRDVVNMFFVVILLVIAFATVLGLEQYEWKKLLVKLVFAAVLVNFSRLICGVIIDVAQVFMMTFVNGFAATAGGNVINGLNLNSLYQFSENATSKNLAQAEDMLITGLAAVFFSAISMFVLGAYLIVILARVVTLWTLIVLSPIAFMSSVLPATQKYASEWWKEFNNNVLAGPLLAFFFWLSFAIVGSGNAFQEVLPTDDSRYATEGIFADTSSGVAKAMDWGAMASFAIAIALLMTGVKKTQELGVSGASALGKAMSTATRVAKVASGVAAVGWGAGKVVQGGKWAAKGVAMKMPIVGGDSWKRRGRSIKARVSERWADHQSERETKLAKNLKDREKNKIEVARDLPGVVESRKKAQEELKKAQKELKNEEKRAPGIKTGVKEGLAQKVAEAQEKFADAEKKEKDLKSKETGTFWASVALTERQKEKQVKNLENAAKSADEERDETLGLGGTEIGKRSGRRMMKKKLASEQAEQDKIVGLAGAEAEELKKLGKFDEADAVLENAQAKVNKMESEKFANLSLDTLKLRMSEAVKNRKKALEKYESSQSDEEKKQALADANKSSKDVMRLLGIGATQGSSSKQALADIALNAAGMKDRSLDGSAKQLATIATGVNAEKDGGKTTQDIYLKFKGIDEKSWATIIADTKRKGEELQEKTGDASLAAAVSSGVQESEDGKFSKVVSDIGSNHGNKKFDGSDQTGKDYLATDEERLKYFRETSKLRMSEPLTVESLVSEQISKDKDGNITENVKFDKDKTAITARILSESSPAMIGKIINNTFVKSLLPLLKLEGDQVKIVAKMLNELKEGRKDDKNWCENFDKAFGENILDILEKKGGYERTPPSTKKDKGALGDGEDPGDEPKK